MLPAAHRLTDPDSFRRAQRRGRRSSSRLLVAHLLVGSTREHAGAGQSARVGLVVAKSVGNAVSRNRVKRRLRHLARHRLAQLPEGSVWVLRALPGAGEATYADLRHDLDRCLRHGRSARPREREQESR